MATAEQNGHGRLVNQESNNIHTQILSKNFLVNDTV